MELHTPLKVKETFWKMGEKEEERCIKQEARMKSGGKQKIIFW